MVSDSKNDFETRVAQFRHPITKVSEVEFRIDREAHEGMNVPVTIYANEGLLSKMLTDRTIDQAVNVAHLNGLYKHVIVLPDGHEGYGFPIGGVAASDANNGVISPGGVGYDINCGVRLIRTALSENDVRPKLRELLKELFRDIPSGVGTGGRIKLGPRQLEDVLADGVAWAVENGYGWDSDKEYCEENGTMKTAKPQMVSPTAKKRGAPQLGSLGSGNHFVEIQKVDKIYNPQAAKTFGLDREGQVVIMAHTGSRGLGYQVCSDYLRVVEGVAKRYGIKLPDRELACAPIASKEAEDYIGAMNAALNFAWSNRQMITHWTRRAFEKVLGSSAEGFEMNLVYDVSHNIAKIEEHNIDGSKRKVTVHRKGATRAFPKGRTEVPIMYRKVGQPVLIPGSMGTASYVLVGAPRSMEVSFGSTAHGAGRMMSRSAAVRRWRGEDVKRELAARGIHIESASWRGVAEEAPEAYKDVDAVAEVSDRTGIATRVARLVPMGVVKG